MFSIFEKYLQSYGNFTADEIARVRSLTILKRVKRGEHLMRLGDVCRYHTFVCSGTLYHYRVDEVGIPHILDFAIQNNWIFDEISLYASEPALGYIDAMENTTVVQISAENFKKLSAEIQNFAELFKNIILENLKKNADRIYSMISRPAKDQYHDFKLRYPDIYHHLPIYMIASYLGVTRETLTRIRRDVHSKG